MPELDELQNMVLIKLNQDFKLSCFAQSSELNVLCCTVEEKLAVVC